MTVGGVDGVALADDVRARVAADWAGVALPAGAGDGIGVEVGSTIATVRAR